MKRLLLLVGVAAVLFGAGYALTNDDEASCPTGARADPAYALEVEGAPATGSGSFELVVTKSAQPVTDADVCLTTVMVGMEEMGAADEATRTATPGRYRVSPEFEMRGEWTGQVVIVERGQQPVSVPLSIKVDAPPAR